MNDSYRPIPDPEHPGCYLLDGRELNHDDWFEICLNPNSGWIKAVFKVRRGKRPILKFAVNISTIGSAAKALYTTALPLPPKALCRHPETFSGLYLVEITQQAQRWDTKTTEMRENINKIGNEVKVKEAAAQNANLLIRLAENLKRLAEAVRSQCVVCSASYAMIDGLCGGCYTARKL